MAQTPCNAANSSRGRPCYWQQYDGGWCEEVGCWSYEGNQANCENSSLHLGINCVYENNWCYENVSAKSCSSMTLERDCMDTYYCIWNFTSQICQTPIVGTIETKFDEWRPGCYIFDTVGRSLCDNVTGCNWNNSLCISNTTNGVNEVRCGNITNSTVCNNIAMLSTCCKWQAGTCAEDKFSKQCWEEMQEMPEGATYCEDYNSYTDQSLCIQIAGDPWYMPCRWDNSTERCKFKSENIFSGTEENIMLIDNQKNCESAGGKWLVESYASSNDPLTAVAVSMPRCDYKFDEERNCDKECHACEFQTDKTAWTSAAKAKEACINSALGMCGFRNISSAPNGFGYCEPKDEFKKGIATDCDSSCGTCTFMGDSTSAEVENRPSSFCKNSKAKCKWIPDMDYPTDESKGRCGSNSEKTCENKCDVCYEEDNCINKGAKKGNTSLDTQCSWSSSLSMCTPKSGSDQMEICWDGSDNNADGKMDCADSMCWSDSFCGGQYMMGFGGKDCFGSTTQALCELNGCVWVNENWGSWCDMPGANCWKNDGNQASCQNNGNCTWHSGFGGFCEENWTASTECMNLNQAQCALDTDCDWVIDSYSNNYGGWCGFDMNYSATAYVDCAGLSGEAACEAMLSCNWFNSTGGTGYGGGWCDNKKFTCWRHTTQLVCENLTNTNYCTWISEYGNTRCEGKGMGGVSSSASCWNYNEQAGCIAHQCNWVSGFCDPAGFGNDMGGGAGGSAAIGGSGTNCMLYNGNIIGCNNQSGCGWFAQSTSFCEVNYQDYCPQYSYNASLCGNHTRCRYNNNMQMCEEKTSQCFSLNANRVTCEGNSLCYWTNWSTCEPICFNSTKMSSSNACNAITTSTNGSSLTACNWNSGWCNPSASVQMFKGMEMGAPTPLGTDPQSDTRSGESDILGFGMKDMGMGKAYGFGINVASVANSSMCNGVKLSSGSIGNGKNTTNYFWYLDTNQVTTGGCALPHDASQVGYEFYFKQYWTWSNSTGEASETLEAYRCSNGTWVKAAIPLQSFKELSCGQIGGGMVSVEKAELERFPTLYTTGADLRVTVTTADANGNITTPSDNITITNIGWATPGAIDQEIDNLDLYKYKSNSSQKIGEGSSKGYIVYSDVDCWTEAGCADYACAEHPYCDTYNYGVEAANYSDTRMPMIVGITKETYTTAAMVTYFTNKPANGTLTLYGPDSTCSPSNNPYNPVHDIGATSADARDYKLWHIADIDEAVLGAPLASGVTYYYKLKVCDKNGKCSTSKCSKLITPANDNACGFCEYVTKIDVPTGWNVSYDLNTDGVYEHAQGAVCGANVGMFTNYTDGNSANIRLTKSDNSSYIEFINAKLTKTGLSTKIRNVSSTNAFSTSTTTTSTGETIGYVGMIEDVRDKIVNNLYPEICYVKIPKGTGNCTELWHCDNTRTKCLNRTANATLNQTGTDYCIWKIPYCEFSTWAGGQPGTASSSGTSSGGGSGAGSGGGGTSGDISTVGEAKTSKMFSKPAVGTYLEHAKEAGKLAVIKTKFKINTILDTVELKIASINKETLPKEIPRLENNYQYLEYTVSTKAVSDITIEFKVEKAWVTNNKIDKDSVKLNRFNGKWKELSTQYSKEKADYYYYSAAANGFSYFAITGQPIAAEEKAAVTAPEIKEEIVPGKEPEKNNAKTIILMLIVLGIVGIVYGYMQKKR